MKKYFLIILISFNSIIGDDYILYSPIISYPDPFQEYYTYLINKFGEIKHVWEHEASAASTPYLNDEGILFRPSKVEFPIIDLPGRGGIIEKVSWDGNVLFEFIVSDEWVQQHHDIEVLSNGNILVLAWEKKLQEDVILKGKVNHTGVLYIDMILELQPISSNNANIVWEWHFWDHLIQNVNTELDNYGNILDNPELLDINYLGLSGEGPNPDNNPDFIHCNAIHYNQDLDQIILTSRRANEIYIIDHSTTTEEAMGHSGGIYGKGGDFLYRWGNPRNYHAGLETDQVLFSPHSANWVNQNYPGSGNILIFNNGVGLELSDYSSVIEIEPPLNINNFYNYEDGLSFLPTSPILNYNNNFSFFSQIQSGAFRLINGNTIITVTNQDLIFEINQENEIVWEYNFSGNGHIARALYYDLDFIFSDINHDGLINIQDVIILIEIILINQNSYATIINNDINQDGFINIFDIITIINLLL